MATSEQRLFAVPVGTLSTCSSSSMFRRSRISRAVVSAMSRLELCLEVAHLCILHVDGYLKVGLMRLQFFAARVQSRVARVYFGAMGLQVFDAALHAALVVAQRAHL